MSTRNHTIRLRFDTLVVRCDLAQASSPIQIVTRDENSETGERITSTPYQCADARHAPRRMARLAIQYLGDDYFLDGSEDIGQDEDGMRTIDGMSEDDYIDALILSVK